MTFIKASSIFKYSLNLGIRGATIGLKFLFALFLGKFFPEDVLGEYGLFATSVLVSYLLLSLSFDSYAIRELIEKPRDQQLSYVRNVFAYFALAFCVYVSIGILFLNQSLISDQLIYYFAILLFLETITQIIFSLFTILQMPTGANTILFLSQGSWIILVFLFWLVNPSVISTVGDIMMFWICGSLIGCIYGLHKILKYYKDSHLEPLNWKWIRSGLPISLLFFCSSFGYKAIEYADRYFIEFKLGAGKLGIYVFYSQIANIMNAVISVTVILMLYPRLIENYANKEFKGYLAIKKKMYQRIILISIIIAGGAIVFMKIALAYIGKESFYQHISVFYILLASNLAMNLSFISHYCMYAMRKDAALVYTTIVGSFSSVILNYYWIDLFDITGAAMATCCSFALIWILKSVYVTKKEKDQLQ